jgi:hypothetical protein
MINITIPYRAHHLYGNWNQYITTFLEDGVDVERNGAMTTKGKFPLEINYLVN